MLNYPLELSFKIATIHTRVRILDAAGKEVAYVRKKALKLKEEVTVYENEGETTTRFRITADRVLDFNASYTIEDAAGRPLGSVAREGTRSLWKSSYKIPDINRQEIGQVQEENPWTKVLDGLFEIIPFADTLGGLVFNPAYLIDLRGSTALRLQKRRALFEGRFSLEKRAEFSEKDEELLLASIIMMVLLERDRG